MRFKTFLAAAVLSGASALGANAAVLNGTFTIDLYNYDAGGSSAAAAATVANVTANTLTASITYTGDLNFYNNSNTSVRTFLEFGGGSFTEDSGDVDALVLSSGGFTTTTLFDITGVTPRSYNGTITHDDGITLLDGAGNIIADSSAPTSSIATAFSNLPGGNFRLIYSAANGNPEVLSMDVAPVPLPAGGLLLAGALGGLAALRRRRKTA